MDVFLSGSWLPWSPAYQMDTSELFKRLTGHFPGSSGYSLFMAYRMSAFAWVVVTVVPVILACILLNKYFFKSAEGIDGAING